MKSRIRICLIILLLICASMYAVKSDIISLNSKQQIINKLSTHNEKSLPIDQPEEWVSNLLLRESSGILTLWNQNIIPKYIWGDFNGDKTIDLLVPASINRKVEFNYRNLSAFDVDKVHAIGLKSKARFPLENLKADRNDITPLLVIFHGVTGSSKKSFQVSEKFIVIDGTESNPKQMFLFRGTLKRATAGDELKIVTPPALIGDAILFLDEYGGTAIFWYEGKYHWYPIDDLIYYQQKISK